MIRDFILAHPGWALAYFLVAYCILRSVSSDISDAIGDAKDARQDK